MSDSLPVLDCRGCGVCCFHMGYPAFNISRDDLVRLDQGETVDSEGWGPAALADLRRWIEMPPELRQEILQRMSSYVPPTQGQLDTQCTWLDRDTRVCKHHLHRPQVCRDFEVGCQQCLDWRDHYHDSIRS